MLKRLCSTVSKQNKKAIITVTDNAWNKLNLIAEKSNNPYFLFSANGGGCNGFKYILEQTKKEEVLNYNLVGRTVNNTNKNNHEINYPQIAIEPMSELLLIGTTIDFATDDFDSKFVFTPDKTFATSCGCGVSFSPKN